MLRWITEGLALIAVTALAVSAAPTADAQQRGAPTLRRIERVAPARPQRRRVERLTRLTADEAEPRTVQSGLLQRDDSGRMFRTGQVIVAARDEATLEAARALGFIEIERTALSASGLTLVTLRTPDDVDAWFRLAEARVVGGDYAAAAEAYQHLAARGVEMEGLHSALGESLVFARGGVVGNDAHAAFETALLADPADMRARYYLAEADYQLGRADAAIAVWAELAEDAPRDAPWLTTLARRLTNALTAEGRSFESLGLTDAALAALERAVQGGADPEFADQEQAEMIAGMVDRLAARLEADPDDVEGWRMLARSYGVLGRLSDMAEAYAAVARLSPGDVDAAREHAYARLQALTPQTPLDATTLDALEVLLALDERDPLARLVLGEQEFKSGDRDRGRALLEALTADEGVDAAVRARADETLAEIAAEVPPQVPSQTPGPETP